MTKQELIIKPHQEFSKQVKPEADLLETWKKINPLIVNINNLIIDIKLDYETKIELLYVSGTINFNLTLIDARTGENINYEDIIDWQEAYSFNVNDSISGETNVILQDEFNLISYAIEQIELNLPIGISKNSEKLVLQGENWRLIDALDEQTYLESKEDPRWDKLKELFLDK